MDTGLRRYYWLTPPGAQRLAAEVERMRAHTTLAARRLGLGAAVRVPDSGVARRPHTPAGRREA